MFLAFNEIRREARRYTMITALITLVGLLVFFLTGLAVGLDASMTNVVRHWPATNIYLSTSANQSVLASHIPESGISERSKTSAFGLAPATIQSQGSTDNSTEQINVFMLGVDSQSFIAPKVSEGEIWTKPGEVVVDSSLKAEGFKIGDSLELNPSTEKFTITGFSNDQTYSSNPMVFGSIADWQSLGVQYTGQVSAIASDTAPTTPGLSELSTKEFMTAIPGVSAQNATFALMIGALIIISAVMLGVFTYVLTMQKQTVFGVMKTQGISNAMIGWSVLWQTGILAIFGSLVAVGISMGIGLALPSAVPFAIPLLLWVAIGAIIVLFSLAGALFSVRAATRIDPLEALR